MSDNSLYAKALGKVPSGLFVITAADGDRQAAYLASFVQQVSFDPLIFSVACHPQRYPCEVIRRTKKFGLNILAEDHHHLLRLFAKGHGPDENPVAKTPVHMMHGVPLLRESLGGAVFDVIDQSQPGDHVVFYGLARDGALFNDGLKPWVHVRKSALTY